LSPEKGFKAVIAEQAAIISGRANCLLIVSHVQLWGTWRTKAV
jgi:hypothetical protein